MNLYKLFDRAGRRWAVFAAFSFEAIRVVEKLGGEQVSCWEIWHGSVDPKQLVYDSTGAPVRRYVPGWGKD